MGTQHLLSVIPAFFAAFLGLHERRSGSGCSGRIQPMMVTRCTRLLLVPPRKLRGASGAERSEFAHFSPGEYLAACPDSCRNRFVNSFFSVS